VLGEEGLGEGHDHRGVPVLAAIRPLADSSWFIVVQVEQTQVRKTLGEQAWISGSVFGLLMLATGLALALAWYHREHRFLHQLKEQDELLVGQERMRIAMDLVQAAEWELDVKQRSFDRSSPHDGLFGYD